MFAMRKFDAIFCTNIVLHALPNCTVQPRKQEHRKRRTSMIITKNIVISFHVLMRWCILLDKAWDFQISISGHRQITSFSLFCIMIDALQMKISFRPPKNLFTIVLFIIVVSALAISTLSRIYHKYHFYKNIVSQFFRKVGSCLRGFTICAIGWNTSIRRKSQRIVLIKLIGLTFQLLFVWFFKSLKLS